MSEHGIYRACPVCAMPLVEDLGSLDDSVWYCEVCNDHFSNYEIRPVADVPHSGGDGDE